MKREHPFVEMYKQAFLKGAVPKNTLHAAALSGKSHEELVKILKQTLNQSEEQNYSGEPWYRKHRKTLDEIHEQIIKEEAGTPEDYERIAKELRSRAKSPQRTDFNHINRKRWELYSKLHKLVEMNITSKLKR